MNIKQIKKSVIFLLSIGLLIGNVTPLLAQTLELEVIGGGFKLRGPQTINFATVQSSFSEQSTQLNFRSLKVENTDDKTIEDGSIVIIDENGGKTFSVSVTGTDLVSNGGTCSGPTPYFNCIPATNFFIKNWDGNGNSVNTLFGSSTDLTVNPSTASFSALNNSLTLADGAAHAPGMWKIYPELQITIPAGQNPGEYSGTLSFTIT